MEMRGVDGKWLHIYGSALIALRLIHPVILFDTMDAPLWKKVGRFVSAAGTALMFVIGAVVILLS